MSSWTRTIVVPLSIFSAHKPVRRLPPEKGIAELFLRPPDKPLWPRPAHETAAVLDQLLPRSSTGSSSSSTLGAAARCASGPSQGRAWMRDAFQRQRRRRRHLPADDLHGHLPATASASRRRSGDAVGPEAARRPDDRGGRHDPLAAVLFAGLGHGPGAECPGAMRPSSSIEDSLRSAIATSGGDWLLAKEVRQPRRLELDQSRTSSRAAGSSSIATAFIPTPTTRPWC